jgi:hypothetical protein
MGAKRTSKVAPQIKVVLTPRQTHVRSHGDDAGEQMSRIGLLLHVPTQDMGECPEKPVFSALNRNRSAMPMPGNWPKKGLLMGSSSEG